LPAIDTQPDKTNAANRAAAAWLTTPLGQALLAQEQRVVEEAIDGIFGEQCLQIGRWGAALATSIFFGVRIFR